jgi:hypothetical protein
MYCRSIGTDAHERSSIAIIKIIIQLYVDDNAPPPTGTVYGPATRYSVASVVSPRVVVPRRCRTHVTSSRLRVRHNTISRALFDHLPRRLYGRQLTDRPHTRAYVPDDFSRRHYSHYIGTSDDNIIRILRCPQLLLLLLLLTAPNSVHVQRA